jgi:hypothetical protein
MFRLIIAALGIIVLLMFVKVIKALARALFGRGQPSHRATRSNPRNLNNPMNPNSMLNPNNPMNPNSMLNPSNPNSPMARARRFTPPPRRP